MMIQLVNYETLYWDNKYGNEIFDEDIIDKCSEP